MRGTENVEHFFGRQNEMIASGRRLTEVTPQSSEVDAGEAEGL